MYEKVVDGMELGATGSSRLVEAGITLLRLSWQPLRY
jgi:hypothetical protein